MVANMQLELRTEVAAAFVDLAVRMLRSELDAGALRHDDDWYTVRADRA